MSALQAAEAAYNINLKLPQQVEAHHILRHFLVFYKE